MIRLFRSVKVVFLASCLAICVYLMATDYKTKHDKDVLMQYRQNRFIAAQNRPGKEGPGENGQPVVLTEDEKKIADTLFKNASFNVFSSEKIAMDRSIPDTRRQECRVIEYPVDLPTISVVLIFNNEALSAVLRTVHSVVNRTPPRYLHEVILLDDCSDHEELLDNLDKIVAQTWPDGIVKVVRRESRGGLVKARVSGARAASGDTIVIMDAHMEVNVGWAEPMLFHLKKNPTAVVLPVIDVITDKDLKYGPGSGLSIQGFTWAMFFWWMDAPKRLVAEQNKPTDPIKSFAMVGCVFAMNREYFFHIGAFDEGMGIWGGENVELPLRVWMCGGSVYQLPCSRIGHLYRSSHPFTFPEKDVMGHNAKRVVEVWLDDYKRLFYNFRPDLKTRDVGDLSERKALREKLQCHSFEWFLKNIYLEKFIPDENVISFGLVENPASKLCLDTLGGRPKEPFNLGLFPCRQGNWRVNQFMSFSKENELRMELKCFQNVKKESGSEVKAVKCSDAGGLQQWHWDKLKERIMHVATGLCLDVNDKKPKSKVTLKTCVDNSEDQTWRWLDYYQ